MKKAAKLKDFSLFTFHFSLGSSHAHHANDDEGYRENLSHIEGQVRLKRHLYILRIFDEEAEGEESVCFADSAEERFSRMRFRISSVTSICSMIS